MLLEKLSIIHLRFRLLAGLGWFGLSAKAIDLCTWG